MRLASCAARDGWGAQILPFLQSAGVARAVEHMLAVAFGNKLCWFQSRYWHISLCSPGSWKRASSSLRKQTMLVQVPLSAYLCSPGSWRRASSSLRKQTMLVWVPLSAYFFMYPYNWKHLLKGIVQRASMMGVLGTQGGFALALFQGWGGEVKYCWKMCSSNFSFQNKFIIFLSCGLLVDKTHFKNCAYLKV